MSEETATQVAANPAATMDKPGLHPETQAAVTSMAEKFRQAMGKSEPRQQVKAEPSATIEPDDHLETDQDAQTRSDAPKESRSAKDFKLIKGERDAAKQQVAELLSKLSSFEEQASIKSEYEKLKSEYDQISETLTVTNLERHPRFKEQYVKPVETQIERAASYVPAEQREQLAKILRMPVSESRANALDDLVGDLPASRQAYLQSIVSKIDEISYERDAQLAAARESYSKLQQEETLISNQKTAERNTALEKSFNTMLKQAQDQIGIYQLREGDEEWNTGVRERVNLAKKILMEQNSFEDAATAALWAASGGALLEQNTALVEHNRRLTAELQQLKGVEPSMAGGATEASRTQPRGDTFSDRVLGELRNMGVAGARAR